MLSSFTHSQKSRLAYIDFCLQYFGQVARADLIQHFQTGQAAATRDLAAYRKLAPDNLTLNHQTKHYLREPGFTPLFIHEPDAVLYGLQRGFGDGYSTTAETSDRFIDAVRLIHPHSEHIARLARAVLHEMPLSCRYVSLSSGEQSREVVPHAMINNGHRWHIRAFDRNNQEFRDFVCTRFTQLNEASDPPLSHETRGADHQWNRIVDIELKPHPQLMYPKAVELDYGMQNGLCRLEIRAAVLGYLLQQWNVDCSPDNRLRGGQYQLALANQETLYGVANLTLAPGYQEPMT